jgi:hypothetical protein
MAAGFDAGGDLLGRILEPNHESIVARRIAGEMMLVPIRGKLADMQKIYVLDTVGEFIWRKLDGKRSGKEICREVLKAFAVGEDEAEADTREFLASLVNERLLVERP